MSTATVNIFVSVRYQSSVKTIPKKIQSRVWVVQSTALTPSPFYSDYLLASFSKENLLT